MKVCSLLFKWSDDYSVGISKIDDQHKRLIGLINDLHEAMKQGKGKEELSFILLKLTDYSLYHFETEEELLKRYEYEELLPHQEQHLSFINRVRELKRRHEEGEFMVSMDTGEFMKEWLSTHILISDKKFGPFLRSMGER